MKKVIGIEISNYYEPPDDGERLNELIYAGYDHPSQEEYVIKILINKRHRYAVVKLESGMSFVYYNINKYWY